MRALTFSLGCMLTCLVAASTGATTISELDSPAASAGADPVAAALSASAIASADETFGEPSSGAPELEWAGSRAPFQFYGMGSASQSLTFTLPEPSAPFLLLSALGVLGLRLRGLIHTSRPATRRPLPS